MRQPSFLRQFALGLLLGALLLPQSAYAQFGGVVHDPVQTNVHIANFARTMEKWQKEINHWMEEIDKYNRMIERAERQIQGLDNLLKSAEQIAARDRELRQTMSTLGRTVRLAFRLKNQIVNSVFNQARALRRMEERVRSGGAWQFSLSDLEYWLRNDIGRYSEQTIAEEQRLINMDNELDRYLLEKQQALERAAEYSELIEKKNEAVETLRKCTDCTDKDVQIAHLDFEINRLNREMESALDRSREYDERARKRTEAIIQHHEENMAFGRDVSALEKAWKGVRRAEKSLREKIYDDAKRKSEEALDK